MDMDLKAMAPGEIDGYKTVYNGVMKRKPATGLENAAAAGGNVAANGLAAGAARGMPTEENHGRPGMAAAAAAAGAARGVPTEENHGRPEIAADENGNGPVYSGVMAGKQQAAANGLMAYGGNADAAANGFMAAGGNADAAAGGGHEETYSGAMRQHGADGNGKIAFLENGRNLKFPHISSETVDSEQPLSSFQIAGNWLREAANLENYAQGIMRFGEDIAAYKWAYDEKKMGAFDGEKFRGEMFKAGMRSLASDSLRTIGNATRMLGANMAVPVGGEMKETPLGMLAVQKAGEVLQSIGKSINGFAEKVYNAELLAPAPEAYDEDPNWTKLANVLGQGSSQVLAMGAMSKFIGSRATYGFFAAGGATEMFNEAYDKNGDVGAANTMAALNGTATYAIDRLFSPLPKQLEARAKMTSQMIAKEIAGAPLREAGTEVLQQMLAENLVRKVGIDATQDLFEGLVESALGAIAGSTSLMAADGSAYAARRSYDNARRRMIMRGVTEEEIELAKNNMLEVIRQKPEAFEKVLHASLEENLKVLEDEAARAETSEKKQAKKADAQGFRKIYNEMRKRALQATGDEHTAKTVAGLVQTTAMVLHEWDNSISPQAFLLGNMPEVRRVTSEALQQELAPAANVSLMFAGTHAKNADMKKLLNAYELERGGTEDNIVWSVTGWHRGADGLMRMEINDSNAKLKLLSELPAAELPKQFWRPYILELEQRERQEIRKLQNLKRDMEKRIIYDKEVHNSFYNDFVNYLDENYERQAPEGKPYDKTSFYEPMTDYFRDVIGTRREKASRRYQSLVSGYNLLRSNVALSARFNSDWGAYIPEVSFKEMLAQHLTDGKHPEAANEAANGAAGGALMPNPGENGGNPFSFNTSEFNKSLSEEGLRRRRRELLRTYRGKKIYNSSLSAEMEIRQNITDKHFQATEEKFKSLLAPYLPLMLSRAEFNKAEGAAAAAETGVKAYYKAVLDISLDGAPHTAHITVQEDDKGFAFRNLTIDEDAPVPVADAAAPQTENANGKKRKLQPANDNFYNINRLYTSKELRAIRAILDSRLFDEFEYAIWDSNRPYKENEAALDEFINGLEKGSKAGEAQYEALDEEFAEKRKQREKIVYGQGLDQTAEAFYDDLNKEYLYRKYLLATGKEYVPADRSYRPLYYRQAYAPALMSEKFLNQRRYDYLSDVERNNIFYTLNQVERIYRLHRELEYAKSAQLRDVEAANAYLEQRFANGEDSIREYWQQRLLLEKQGEIRLGDLLEHEALYANYPELKDIKVRFGKLDDGRGYHFYHKRQTGESFLEIDLQQFDYAGLKDVVMKGAQYAIQMKEGFDPAFSDAQRKNFMDSVVSKAKEAVLPLIEYRLADFVGTYLTGEDVSQFIKENEQELPETSSYKSRNESNGHYYRGGNLAYFKDIDFDALEQKLNERFGIKSLVAETEAINKAAYREFQKLKSDYEQLILAKARAKSGYWAPIYPWGGLITQGQNDMSAMLRRMDYSDWQRSFPYWTDDLRPPVKGKDTPLVFKDSLTNVQRMLQEGLMDESLKYFPEDEELRKRSWGIYDKDLDNVIRGAYDYSRKMILLTENANTETIVHESFHYFSQLLSGLRMQNNVKVRQVYAMVMEYYRQMFQKQYDIAYYDGSYILTEKGKKPDIKNMKIVPRRFETMADAVQYGTEEIFVQRFMDEMDGTALKMREAIIEENKDIMREEKEIAELYGIDTTDINAFFFAPLKDEHRWKRDKFSSKEMELRYFYMYWLSKAGSILRQKESRRSQGAVQLFNFIRPFVGEKVKQVWKEQLR